MTLSWKYSILFSLLFLLNDRQEFVLGFAAPKSEFLLDIDGNSVSTGREHVCVIEKKQGNTVGGRARCFGFDHFEGRTRPPEDIEFVQIITGFTFSCGIAIDQTVHCWGSISSTIPGLYTQITSDSGSHFACGILVDGSLNCWGFYDHKLRPPSPPDVKFVQISCAEKHCCALDDKGYPYCWGEGSPATIEPPKITYKEYLQSKANSGWLVREEKDEYEDEEEETASTPEESETSFVQFRQISVGESLSCGISLLGGHLYCWGSPEFFHYNRDIPRQKKGPFRQVSVGSLGVCAILADPSELTGVDSSAGIEVDENHSPDRLLCWGTAKNLIDQSRFDAWDQISVGTSYICGVSMESEVECGGYIPIRDHKDIVVA